MDIQDILHDSGMGKDTHSIISQGKLDAILQSRPEERRSLIEEAAGISKHKRRKERALRKIASMDEHLTRARDINREIARQLRPLERQVDRARKHRELTARANELTQILAVDELRRLQAAWSDLEIRGKEAEAGSELARYRLSEKERELEKLQVMLEEKGLFVGDLGEQRRHMQDVVGRIGSDMRLLEEKGRNMVARLSEMRGTLSGSEHQRRRVVEELDDLRARLDDARAAAEVARADVEKAEPASDDLHARRVDLDEQLRALTRDMREQRSVADSCALDYVKVKEALSNAELEDSMYASRLEQIDAQAEEVAASLESRRDRADEVEELLADARAQRDDMQEAIKAARDAQDARRAQEGEARGRLSDVRSELSSLERLDERAADASPLAAQISRGRAEDVLARLGDVIEAPSELESLVEHLLGADIDALLVAGDEELARLGAYAQGLDATGQALLLSCSSERSPEVPAAGYRLVERLRVRDGYAQAVAALLGGVYVVDSVGDAVAAPRFPGVVYVTPDDARVAGPTVRIGSLGDAADGVLERKRRIRELEELEPELSCLFDTAAQRAEEAAAALADARAKDSEAAGEIARLEGERRSLLSEIGRLEQSLSKAQAERTQVARRRSQAAESVRDAQPQLEELASARDAASAEVERISRKVDEVNDELERVRVQDAEAAGKLSDAKVRLAQAAERIRSLCSRPPARAPARGPRPPHPRDESGRLFARGAAPSGRSLARSVPGALGARHGLGCAPARPGVDRGGRLRFAQADHRRRPWPGRIRQAGGRVRRRRGERGEVERGKLEVQVENAVSAITADGTTVLEEALALPAPSDRAACERELSELVRKINNLGPVNQVAFEEYERLRERADYISVSSPTSRALAPR